MHDNIIINKEKREVYLSNELLFKIKYLIKGYHYLKLEEYDALSTNGIDYYDFRCIIDSIARNFNIGSDIYLKDNRDLNFDSELEDKLKNLFIQYLKMNPNKEDESLLYKFKDNLSGLEQLIDVVTEITQTENKMYLLRDLVNAKDDYIKDMKYFMKNEEINVFELEYSKAIKEKNTDKMLQMLNNLQKLILKEWKKYIGNIDTMNEDSFCFIGHSTGNTKFEGDFYTRYVSCSLFNQNVNDTYRSGFGFIMMPTNIVGANSSDMYVNNYSYDDEFLLNYSSISKIHHPQRLIDECIKYKHENIKNNKKEKVYSEVVIDGFNPVGIFCFTNGAHSYDYNYKNAMKLQKSFPNLNVKIFDLMKVKSGEELKSMQLDLVNSLRLQLTKNDYSIKMKDLSRYELFFRMFSELKKLDSYREEDIEKLFKYNLNLLSIFDKDVDSLFNGSYNDEEIKFILGKNILYNIDFILDGDITPYSLEKLKSLINYKDKLNKYYDGLEEFIELLIKIDINDNIIEEIKKETPINFYKMSKIILNNLSNNLDKRQSNAQVKLDNLIKRYQNLSRERNIRKDLEEKYNIYLSVYNNQGWYSILKNEFEDLEKNMSKDNFEEDELLKKKKQIENEINNLILTNNIDLSSNYQNSYECIDIQNRINILKEQQSYLKKHPLLNFRKLRKINIDIKNLEEESIKNNEYFEIKKKNNITNRELKIELLKSELQSIEYQLSYIKEKKDNNQKDLINLNKKVFEYFNCNSIKEVIKKIHEAKEFIENYDCSNSINLQKIEKELQIISEQILVEENELQNIEEERKIVSI